MLTVRQILIYLAIKYEGNWDSIYEAVKNKEKLDEEDVMKIPLQSEAITILDEDYPSDFKNQYKPPFVVFYRGNRGLLSEEKKLGVIGTREMSDYGEKCSNYLLDELGKKTEALTVISGMAKGIDGNASRAAIRNRMKLISIIGTGVDICYPSTNKDIYEYCQTENGLLLSEYPLGVKPLAENFPMRNRMIASLSTSLLIVEAGKKSGTSITVRYAIEQGKDVLSVPNDIFATYSFTNELIACGAIPCLGVDDILTSLKI